MPTIKRKGECYRCGKCCTAKIQPPDEPPLIPPDTVCPHLTHEILPSGSKIPKCAIYNLRPWFCRKYPEVREDLVPGCGFFFRKKGKKKKKNKISS